MRVSADARLLSQAFTSVYKNAAESIARRTDEAGLDELDGQVMTRVGQDGSRLVIAISDNGTGWPYPDRDRVLEPYVTTRNSGTGLGLAIVKRIAEDHGGSLQLGDRPDGKSGAHLELKFPIIEADMNDADGSEVEKLDVTT